MCPWCGHRTPAYPPIIPMATDEHDNTIFAYGPPPPPYGPREQNPASTPTAGIASSPFEEGPRPPRIKPNKQWLKRKYEPKEFWERITRPSKYGPPAPEWVAQVKQFVMQWTWGDEIWEYSWQTAPLAGEQGWWIVRDGFIVANLVGMVS